MSVISFIRFVKMLCLEVQLAKGLPKRILFLQGPFQETLRGKNMSRVFYVARLNPSECLRYE